MKKLVVTGLSIISIVLLTIIPVPAQQMGGLEPASRIITLNNSMTTEQIQSTINAVGKYIPYGVRITFQFADGSYELTSRLVFGGFYGGGELFIQGNTTENNATALHTSQMVHLDGSSLNEVVYIESITLNQLVVRNLKITGQTTQNESCPLVLWNVSRAVVQYNYTNGTSTTNGFGIKFYNTQGWVEANYVSNVYWGIGSAFHSQMFSYNNDDTGTMPVCGLHAHNASIIGKFETQPSGSSSNEWMAGGSQIR